jgi:hypothetical protein
VPHLLAFYKERMDARMGRRRQVGMSSSMAQEAVFCFPNSFPSCLGMKVKRHDDQYFLVFMIHLASWNAHFCWFSPGLPRILQATRISARFHGGYKKSEKKSLGQAFFFSW